MAITPNSKCSLTGRKFRSFENLGEIIDKKYRINYEITAPEVHLILDDGRSLGVVPTSQARSLAKEKELDLVELNGNARPPIVKILDFNKYRYQQEKQSRGMAKQSNELKEVRLSFQIGGHDLEVKAKKAKEFLDDGDFVRVFINLRGRENIFPEKAKQILLDFQQLVGADLERPISHEGKKVQLIIKKKKNAQVKDEKIN